MTHSWTDTHHLDEAKHERAQLEEQLDASVTEVTAVQTQLKAIGAEKDQLSADLERLSRDLQTKARQLDKSEAEKQVAQAGEAEAKERESALQQRVDALTKELEETKQADQLASLLEQKTALEASKAVADARVQELEEKAKAFKGEQHVLQSLKEATQTTLTELHNLQGQEAQITTAQTLVLKLGATALDQQQEDVIARLQPLMESESIRDDVKRMLDQVEQDLRDPTEEHLAHARTQLETDLAASIGDANAVKEQVVKLFTTYREMESKGLTESEMSQVKVGFLKRVALHHLLTTRIQVQLKRVEALQQQLKLVDATPENQKVLEDMHADLLRQLKEHHATASQLREDSKATSLLLNRLQSMQIHGLSEGNVQLHKELETARAENERVTQALAANEAELVQARSNAARVTELEAELAQVRASLAASESSCNSGLASFEADKEAQQAELADSESQSWSPLSRHVVASGSHSGQN